MPDKKTIIVRGIPVELHKRLKQKALDEDMTLTALIIKLFEEATKEAR